MKRESEDPSCLIIGAGMAGLTAGAQLTQSGMDVTLLDKGRGVGGRMAYRLIGKGCFDHGAQFITARNATFRERIRGWLSEGVIREWSRGFSRSDGEPVSDRFPHYCGACTMSDIPKQLAKGLDVHTGVQVTSISLREGCWEAVTKEGDHYRGDALLLTPPVPQSLSLLDAGGFELSAGHRRALENIEYDPCFAVMALLDGPSRVPEPGGLRMPGEPLDWIADNHMKGISPEAHGLTLHGGPGFSRNHFEEEPDRIAEILFEAAGPWIGSKVLEVQVHRWRYSKPFRLHPEPFLAVDGRAPLVFAGDAFQGPRVEGAALSGQAAAEHLLACIA
ncbi:FAD-dependent oxidoreductase [bacterium]|nr:FAD-dependent oxidoreductase [bacterium]